MDDLSSEINEIAQGVVSLQSKLRVASVMAKEQLTVARTEIKLAKEICGRILTRLDILTKET